MKKPAIAIIIPGGIGTGHNNGGVPVLERLVKLLAKDFTITVFSLFPVNENYKPDGFELIGITTRNLVLRMVSFFRTFHRHHRVRSFQAVHGFWVLPGGLLAVLAGRIFSIKSIVSILGGDAIALPEIKYGQLRNPFSRRLIFMTLKHADEVNALTNYLVNNLRRAGFSRDGIRIIPWGIDTQMFWYLEKELQRPVRFLHIGNLHPVKDQETLLKAFNIISKTIDSTLTIIGEGILKPGILALIDSFQLQERVTILNPIPYEQLPGYYHQADILLHTSLSEGQCEVVTEAMSAGVLVCGTKAGLMADLPDCCVSVVIRDYEQLALQVLKVIADEQRLAAIKERAHQWTAVHSIYWTTDRLADLYKPT
jgi:glycosyltransferase involved in cell wall biosynthesis